MDKMVIYQVFPRWFGNLNTSLINNGTKAENGVGKFSDFTPLALRKIKELGITHVWYTGVIEHATKTDYSTYGIRKDHAAVLEKWDTHMTGKLAQTQQRQRRTHDAARFGGEGFLQNGHPPVVIPQPDGNATACQHSVFQNPAGSIVLLGINQQDSLILFQKAAHLLPQIGNRFFFRLRSLCQGCKFPIAGLFHSAPLHNRNYRYYTQ